MLINFSAVDEPVEKQLTWSKGLGVPNTNKTIVVHFSLKGGGGKKKYLRVSVRQSLFLFHVILKPCAQLLTLMEASLSSWYLAAIPKRVLLLPAVHARLTAVSRLSLTFW